MFTFELPDVFEEPTGLWSCIVGDQTHISSSIHKKSKKNAFRHMCLTVMAVPLTTSLPAVFSRLISVILTKKIEHGNWRFF